MNERSRHIVDEMKIEDIEYCVESIGLERQNFRGRGFENFQIFDFARGANGGGNGFRVNRDKAGVIELAGYGVQSFGQFGGYGRGKDVRPVGLWCVPAVRDTSSRSKIFSASDVIAV